MRHPTATPRARYEQLRAFSAKILALLAQTIPQPKTELIYASNFELLVAVMLSARTTDNLVNRATGHLFQVANTPQKILELGIETVKQYIKSTGFYHTKAQHLIATCRLLIRDFNAEVPTTRLELEQLPGVGRKTANVIMNLAFNLPTIAVDTHVLRVAHRLHLASGKTPQAVEAELQRVIPQELLKDAGMLLLLHGRRICTARRPHCPECKLRELCFTYQNTPYEKS